MNIKAVSTSKNIIPVKHEVKFNILEENIQRSIVVLEDYFDEKWLNKNQDHPLQLLWKRTDPLAISEIHSLAYSIKTVENIDKQWIRKKVDNYKNKTEMGAVFEIIAAAALMKGEKQRIILPPQKNPGYDLTIEYDDNSKINVSCKQHKKSDHYKKFEEKSERFKKRFINMGKSLRFNHLQTTIYAIDHPNDQDWKLLENIFPTLLLQSYDKGISSLQKFIVGNWVIGISDLSKLEMKLSKSFFTYNILINVPFHKNEIKNFLDRLDKGCHNLTTHSVLQDENNINILFVSIGDNYSIDICELWAKEYLDKNLHKPIAGLYFIKPIINLDLERGKRGIVYSIKFIKNDHFDYWNSDRENEIHLELPVAQGFIEEEPELHHLYEKRGEFSSEPAKNQEVYFYQEGKHYLDCTKKDRKFGSFGPRNQKYCVKRTAKGIEIHYLNTNPDHDFLIL